MAFDKRGLADYIEVKDRIIAFREKYPEGSLQSEIVKYEKAVFVDGKLSYPGIVVMRGFAYRTPDDPRPGMGTSQLEIPGLTPYTKGSEFENAETSAWGRALAALGFEVKRSIASAEEIANKKSSEEQIPIRQMVDKLNDVVNPYPHRLRRGIDDNVDKDPSGLVTVPNRVPPPESAIAKTLTPAQAEAMVKMLKLSADAGHNIGNWLAVWGLPTDGAEQLSKSPSVEGNVYAALTTMTQEKGKERFLKARDHYVPKDKREGLVWPTDDGRNPEEANQ